MKTNTILQGDSLEVLKTLPEESINMCMTSPPYWALRDYGVDKQLGLEPTFEEYINNLCNVFDEVKRVLRKDGTCWVNLGDTYYGRGKGAGGNINNSKEVWTFKEKEKRICQHCNKEFQGWKFQNFCGSACSGVDNTPRIKKGVLQDKCLTLIPFRFAIEMVNRGWILRNTIIWHKPNCMPSSAKDRFTVDFEYLFFFVKNKKYWFEAQYEKSLDPKDDIRRLMKANNYSKIRQGGNRAFLSKRNLEKTKQRMMLGKNKRTIWEIPTQPFPESHFAVYPEALCEIPIKSGCPEGGTVLDPFMGAGTTGLVARKLNRKFIGIELNEEYIEIANNRLKPYLEQSKLMEVES